VQGEDVNSIKVIGVELIETFSSKVKLNFGSVYGFIIF